MNKAPRKYKTKKPIGDEALEKKREKWRAEYWARRQKALDYRKAYYESNKEKCRDACNRWKKHSWDSWYEANKNKFSDYRNRNIEKIKARDNAYHNARKAQRLANNRAYRNSPNKIKEIRDYQRNYKKNNRNQYRIYNAKRRSRQECFKEDRKKIAEFLSRIKTSPQCECYYCKHVLHVSCMHIDHVIPLSKNGFHSTSNLAMSCPGCNTRKNALMPSEFSVNGQSFLNL